MICIRCETAINNSISVCPWCGFNHKRMISVLGDSISTYYGYNPEGYSVYYTPIVQAKNGLRSVKDTWWSKVIEELQGDLCVNNSYSGSKASGNDFPSASCEERISGLKTGIQGPNLILVYIGYNDWGYGVPVKEKKNVDSFEEGYKRILKYLKDLYPSSRIICGTLMRTSLKENPAWRFPEEYASIPFSKYNEVIRRLCRDENVELADLEKANTRYETLDGFHPTALGHRQIAEAWIKCCKKLNRERYDIIPKYIQRYLKALHQMEKGCEDYQVEVAVQPDVRIVLEMKGWQDSTDALNMLREMNLVGDRQRFSDWPEGEHAFELAYLGRPALVCELKEGRTYHVEFYQPRKVYDDFDVIYPLYGCPNARHLRNGRPEKNIEIIKYD